MRIRNDIAEALDHLTSAEISMLLYQDPDWTLPAGLDHSEARMVEGRQYAALKAWGVTDLDGHLGQKLTDGAVAVLGLAKVG